MPYLLQVNSAGSWAAAAAEVALAAWRGHPAAVVAFPTGQTPLPLYAELRRRAAAGERPGIGMRAVMLDEYLDAPPPDRFYAWLDREVFTPLAVAPQRRLRMPFASAGAAAACLEFERQLALWGGCDLVFLGLGGNGHVGFNEPGAPLDSRTRPVELSPATARANAAYWHGTYTPRAAVTMGLATILEARQICLLVRGAAKAGILRAALCGPIGPEVPASFLRLAPRLHVIADVAATAALPRAWRGPGENWVAA